MKVLVPQSCPTLCDPMDCSPSGSSVHGILQARIPEWVAMPSSRGFFQSRDQTQVSQIAGRFFTVWATGQSLLVRLWKKAHNRPHLPLMTRVHKCLQKSVMVKKDTDSLNNAVSVRKKEVHRLGFNLSLVQLLELREAFHSADYQCIIREYNSGPVRWEMHRLGVGKGQGTPGYRCPQISMWSLTQKLSEPCPFGLNWLNCGPLVIELVSISVPLSSLEVRGGTEGPNSNDTVGSPDNQPSSWGSSKSHCINIKSGVVEKACCEYQDTFFSTLIT